MANKLKNMELSSVDLCKRGANGEAKIKLFKSKDALKGGEDGLSEEEREGIFTRIGKAMARAMGADDLDLDSIIKEAKSYDDVNDKREADRAAGEAYNEVWDCTGAAGESMRSIIADTSMSAEERTEALNDTLNAFMEDVKSKIPSWANAVNAERLKKSEDEEDDDEEEEDDTGNDEGNGAGGGDGADIEDEESDDEEDEEDKKGVKKGVFDMGVINIESMSAEDQAILKQLEEKYSTVEKTEEKPVEEMHPEVKKALDEVKKAQDEVAELKKAMEIQAMEVVAKQYEIIGKKADELAPKLYELKKAGEQHYNDYVALLDEQVAMANNGIFKEIGSNRSGGTSDLNGLVNEIMKSDSTLTREQAICKAFESNPNLDQFTGKLK